MQIIKKTSLIVVSLILFGTHLAASAADVSPQTVVRWLKEKRQVKVEAIKPIKLVSGEKAFIAALSFPKGLRNFWAGYALVRPKLQQARVIKQLGGQYNGIEVVPNDYGKASIVKLGSAGSGQGYTEEYRSFVVFNGWNVKTLYRAQTLDSNSGVCGDDGGMDMACKETRVSIDVLTTKPFTIVKTTVIGKGSDMDKLKFSRPKKEIIRP